MSEGLLAIGAFSRASLLSIKALRAYHEAGILVPARVDPATGYRTYHVSQLIDAAVIVRLRSLDLPLDMVREVVAARDPEVTAKVLDEHGARMRGRLAAVERIVAALHEGVEEPAAHTPVHIRDEPARYTLAMRGTVNEANLAEFLGRAFTRLEAALVTSGAVAAGPLGALYPPEIRGDDEPVEAFLPVTGPAAAPAGLVNSEVPAARVAVLVHSGAYESIGTVYRHLGAWVARHAEPADLPVREVYLVSCTETDDPPASEPRSSGRSRRSRHHDHEVRRCHVRL